MATIVLSAAGAALGSAVGGTFLGLSATAVGRFAGAVAGQAIDQRLMGQGSTTVEGRRIERIRVTRAGEGGSVSRLWGRMRLPGHVIWSSAFREERRKSGGGGGSGKGGVPSASPTVVNYRYSVSLAVAICDGEIAHVTRIWADGVELDQSRLNYRVYTGAQDQLPDPKIEAIEGTGQVPAYRGTAYVVFEDLQLEAFGNRVPQFSFEVSRPVAANVPDADKEVPNALEAVALMPGTGEYALATTKVHYGTGTSRRGWANASQPTGKSDFEASLDQLVHELPNVKAASLIVSWFGDDLRTGQCRLKPKVSSRDKDGNKMPWTVSGLSRSQAEEIAADGDGNPVYGGTPTDQSIVEAIHALQAEGQAVMFYPFILMEQMAGNGLPDPWSDASDQPVLPWRGRITTNTAPGRAGSNDATAAATDEVTAFFGTAAPEHFDVGTGSVRYTGPEEWSYRRFILHYAALCAAAGGVDSFCIGSEMRGLTQIRGADHSFPAVAALIRLAEDCRALLGPDVKIGYAADWSEYFGYHPQDGSGNVYFHLDPLWAHDAIDFIGIDNYMPLSDWRDEEGHADADWGAIHNVDYLKANVAGAEGYDWYYPTPDARAAQRRDPITDGAYGEPWIFRYKDIFNWWNRDHFERIDGTRQTQSTAWEARSKPIWFTEYGCGAVDKGTNQPNKFLDPKSSESAVPHYSTGARDELIQRQYLRAVTEFWNDPANNPVSEIYGGPMIDMGRAFVWAWDARPFPWFPATTALWTDGPNYARGHWINGRATGVSLAALVTELCHAAGLTEIDVSRLHGFVRGYHATDVADVRALLQPLMLAYGFDAVERGGVLRFEGRTGQNAIPLSPESLALVEELDGRLTQTRASEAEMAGRVRLDYVEAEGDCVVASAEAILPDEATHAVSQSELPLSLTRTEARQTVERWLAEARVSRETARFALPPSLRHIGAGDIVAFEGARYRIDRVEQGSAQILDAVRIEPEVYDPMLLPEEGVALAAYRAPVPVTPFFLDLPLLTGDEVPHAPHLAVTADPWPGAAAVYSAPGGAGYVLDDIIEARAVTGQTQTPLSAAPAGRWDRGGDLEVRITGGDLDSVGRIELFSGRNTAVIGDGSTGQWEVFQFEEAELIAPGTYLLRKRLRGQAGSDGIMPDVWPAGSWVILLDGAPEQVPLSPSQRRLAQHYRIGPSNLPVDDPIYVETVQAFDGNGLRPYRPAHLRVRPDGGDLAVSWVRRTRIDGDSWDSIEVPLGEESEHYLVRVMRGTSVLREVQTTRPDCLYTAAEQAADQADGGASPGWRIEVAQVSQTYGPGPFAVWTAA